jgi:ribonuclease VapC
VIVDSSALVAILFKEADAAAFASALRDAQVCAVAAPTVVEATIVAEGRAGPGMARELDDLLRALDADVVAFTAEHAALARDAWRRFGKGRHPAGLNLGDCFAYALAKARGEPLLFKGDDFRLTDVEVAI